jgi:hypothetical protein
MELIEHQDDNFQVTIERSWSPEVAVTIGDSSIATRPRSPIERCADSLATAVQQRRQHRQKENQGP